MMMDTMGTAGAADAATHIASAPHGQQQHSRPRYPFGLSPVRTVVTSFNPKSSRIGAGTGMGTGDVYDDGDWVLCVTGNDVQNIVACASSSGEIQLYDRTTLRLLQSLDGRSQQEHQSHSQSQHDAQDQHIVTEMSFDTFDANVLAVTSTDGTLRLFDIRQHNTSSAASGFTSGSGAVTQMKLPRTSEEALCLAVGFGGNIAAVGSNKGKIHFFDIRQTRQVVGTYSQSHTDEITRLRFQPSPTTSTAAAGSAILPSGRPSTTPMLVSGSEDGLACIFDTSKPSEDAALQNILAVQTPIREVGFFGPNMDGVYCLTGSECMKLYHMNDSVCKVDFGTDLRSQLTNSLQQQQQQQQHLRTFGNSKAQQNVPQMEYLVNCQWDSAQQQLLLLAASSKGEGGVFEVHQNTGIISPRHCLRGGHRGVVRSWYHPSTSSSFITVGEDARMCEWDPSLCLTQPPTTTSAPAGTPVAPIPMNAYTGLSSPTSSAKKRSIDGTRGSSSSSGGGSGGGKIRRARSRMSAATPF